MSRTEAKAAGFTMIELLVSMIAVLMLGAGMAQFFLTQTHTHAQQEQSVSLEQNLRLASGILTDAIRGARYGAPAYTELSSWVSWISGFPNANPAITYSSGTTVSSLSVTACFEEPVAELSGPANAGGVTLPATPIGAAALTDVLDVAPNAKSLIRIGENGDYAQITGLGGGTISVDTATTSGVQPLSKNYPANTKICRIDVVTFTSGNDPSTGVPLLLRNDNTGGGAQSAAEGIESLQISFSAPNRYTIMLHGRSESKEPLRGDYVRRDLSTTVALRPNVAGS
jgi:Tfp pilus assembly protein PilW